MGRLSPVLPGLMLFLFALVSFSLGHAQVFNAGRAGAMGAEKPGQTLFAGNRDGNRATPVIERRDTPQPLWTGDGWGLAALGALPAADFEAARALSPASPDRPVQAPRGWLARAPPV